MKARAYKITLIVLAAAILCAFLPLDERLESVDLTSVYQSGLATAKLIYGKETLLWLEHQQLTFRVHIVPFMDMSVAKSQPKTFGDHQVTTSSLGESGLVTRFREDPSNLQRGKPIGYPCRLSFRRGNVVSYVEFKEPDKGVHWPDEVNRLSDAEQIALLEEVGLVLDKALIAKAPGVQVIKWSFADTCRVKLQALWDDMESRIIGGGPYH